MHDYIWLVVEIVARWIEERHAIYIYLVILCVPLIHVHQQQQKTHLSKLVIMKLPLLPAAHSKSTSLLLLLLLPHHHNHQFIPTFLLLNQPHPSSSSSYPLILQHNQPWNSYSSSSSLKHIFWFCQLPHLSSSHYFLSNLPSLTLTIPFMTGTILLPLTILPMFGVHGQVSRATHELPRS